MLRKNLSESVDQHVLKVWEVREKFHYELWGHWLGKALDKEGKRWAGQRKGSQREGRCKCRWYTMKAAQVTSVFACQVNMHWILWLGDSSSCPALAGYLNVSWAFSHRILQLLRGTEIFAWVTLTWKSCFYRGQLLRWVIYLLLLLQSIQKQVKLRL